jgi:DNA adenine methylase
MKPLFSYYGGKQRMCRHILPIIESIPHKVYVEPFAGGATLFFAKSPAKISVLNDTLSAIANFYRVCRERETLDELLFMLEHSGYSKELYCESKAAVKEGIDGVKGAYHWYVILGQSVLNRLGSGWARSTAEACSLRSYNNAITSLRANFESILAILRTAHIENVDALDCISKWDSTDTLFYLDPPYVGTNQGHYKGYTLGDLNKLVSTLDSIQGSFVLSSYDRTEFTMSSHWDKHSFEAHASSSGVKSKGARIETVWIHRKGSGRMGQQLLIS